MSRSGHKLTPRRIIMSVTRRRASDGSDVTDVSLELCSSKGVVLIKQQFRKNVLVLIWRIDWAREMWEVSLCLKSSIANRHWTDYLDLN